MPNIQGRYWEFYFTGRELRRLPAVPDLSADQQIEKMIKGGGVLREVVHAACAACVAQWATARRRKDWERDHDPGIVSAGGDKDLAWSAYLEGVTDELFQKAEPEALELLDGELGDDDDGDDD